MAKIIIFYSTTDGHTLKITDKIKEILEDKQHQVTLSAISAQESHLIDDNDKIIIGASIRYGRHKKEVSDFIKENLHKLEKKPTGFFSVSIVARKPRKRTIENNPYVGKFLSKTNWKPTFISIFAGKLDYPRYRFMDKMIIRLIMWIGKGPTDLNATVEFTDWDEVNRFAEKAHLLGTSEE